ncbi:hypothetical protein HY492_00920 [Candidatus Woesearchaeota archaeon]|nr:hypothetical protein [Candidatus Woesearchaeota archaeon]
MHDEQEERRRERNKKILSIGIVVIMVASVLGAFFGTDATPKQKYNGITFKQTAQGVTATIDDMRYAFTFFPQQVEGIPTDPAIASALQNPVLLVTYNPAAASNATMARVQYYLSELFPARFGTFVSLGISEPTSFTFPIITCANATLSQPVLFLDESNQTQLTLDNGCIRATAANDEDLLRIADKLVLLKLGVMTR